MTDKKIGILYDREKFDKAIDRSASALIMETMGEIYASQLSGQNAQEILKGNATSILTELSVVYYQMLENYIDGKKVEDFAEFLGGESGHSYFLNLKAQGMGLMDLLADCKEGLWRVREPEKAIAYYEERFPSQIRRNAGMETEEVSKESDVERTFLQREMEEAGFTLEKEESTDYDVEKREIEGADEAEL